MQPNILWITHHFQVKSKIKKYFKEAFTDIIFCLPHYLYYSPAYLHTLLIFAFCNVDDLSWGTKGSDQKVLYQNKHRFKSN